MKKRLNFKCRECKKKFSLLKEFEGTPKLFVTCPYCGTEGIADLTPYRRKIVEVLLNDFTASGEKTVLDLPDVLPIIRPEEESKR